MKSSHESEIEKNGIICILQINSMGVVHADIELINAEDFALARRNVLNKDEVKSMTVNMLVDSGSYMMAINETIQEQMELPFIEKRKSVMANGHIE